MEGPSEEDIEDVSMPGEQGSEDEVSMSSLHKCTSASQVQNQGLSSTDVSVPGEQGSEDEVSISSLQDGTSTSQFENQSVSTKKRGKQAAVKRWTPEEIAAVEKHLKMFICRFEIADYKRAFAATGGGPAPKPLSPVASVVYAVLGSDIREMKNKVLLQLQHHIKQLFLFYPS
ncbi:unnamed protein product [Gadus morhua 'NCC']